MATGGIIDRLPDGRVRVDDTFVISLNRADGKLNCSGHRNVDFCPHIQHIITEHEDFSLIAAPDSEWSGQLVVVPLVPKHGVWANVRIGDLHEATHAYKIELTVQTDPVKREFLGFLQKGEGRAVIRSMIWAWFQSNILPTRSIYKCRSTAHKFRQEQRWNMHTQHGAPLEDTFAEFWTVWQTGFCLYCNSAMKALDDAIPDSTANWGT